MAQKYIYAVGRKKTASAQVKLYEGKGESFINGRKFDEYILRSDLFDVALKPLKICKVLDGTYYEVEVSGSGESSQASAMSLALARALASQDEGHRKVLKASGLLTRDARKVERKKPGLKKARKSPSWSKR
ncbi:30S ribosomal protein S9 [Candidatus Gracilibacteria bacterium]|nr:30S ribosomal protein S9 [Candidatus Gracilibacteria bacterium]